MKLELDSPGWVRTDMTMNEITVQTGASSRTATDEPYAVNDAATWRARYEQAQQRIAALEGVIRADDERLLKATERVGLAPMGCDTADWLAEEVLGLRRAAAARLRAVKRMKRVARHYQLLALRLAVGAELADVAGAARRNAANAVGRGE